jgi:thymidine kinase
MPEIMGIATLAIPHFARCAYIKKDGAPCGLKATHSQRFRDVEHKHPSHYDDPTIEVDKRKYIPVCEKHHEVVGKYRELRL